MSRFIHPGNTGTQIVLSVLLYDTLTQKEICITGLHLKSGYENYETRRNKEMKTALTIVNDWLKSNNKEDVPQIVSGDFNSEYYLSPSSKYDSLVVDTIQNEFKYNNALEDYSNCDKEDKYYPYVTYNYYHPSIFDYIFYKNLLTSSPGIPRIIGTIPDGKQGSDHLPVFCKIHL